MSLRLLLFRIVLFAIIVFLLFSCARSLTPEKAAGGGYRKARSVL